MKYLRRTSALLLLPIWLLAPVAASAEVEDGEDVLVVRYACLVGGREAGSAPTSAGVLSGSDLTEFLLSWEPESDNEEMRQVFALNDLGELVRQASHLPLAGGAVSSTYIHGGSRFDVDMKVSPAPHVEFDGGIVRISAGIKRDGELLTMPTITTQLSQRAIVSTTNGPEAPFLFLVVEVDRVSAEELRRRGLRHSWRKGYLLVDGEDVIAPVAIEKTPPVYSEVARKERQQGKVILRLMIDAEGMVEDVEVIEGQPYGLTEQAVAAASTWRFQPALRQGDPVPVLYLITINFRLQ